MSHGTARPRPPLGVAVLVPADGLSLRHAREVAVEVRRRGHALAVVHEPGSDAIVTALAPIAAIVEPGEDDVTIAAEALGVDAADVVVVRGLGDLVELARLEEPAVEVDGGLTVHAGWSWARRGHDPADVITDGTSHLTANGRLGYRGTAAAWGRSGFVACVVADTYDTADGKWRELVNAPNGLFASWQHDGTSLDVLPDHPTPAGVEVSTGFDLRLGRSTRRVLGASGVVLEEERFASLADGHVVAQHQTVTAAPGTRLVLTAGIDGDVWQLNGEHLPRLELAGEHDGVLTASGTTVESGVLVAVAQASALTGAEVAAARTTTGERWRGRELELVVGEQGRVELSLVMTVGSSNDDDLGEDVVADLAARAERAAVAGHDTLLVAQVAAWDEVWDRSDVRLDGEPLAQLALRFGIHHNVAATPRHNHRLPIGARGLSCQAYQGAAFWDQEAFNLPMFSWTQPHVARNLLRYRVHTLPGARRKARRLGFRGAFPAWVSGDTGDELCPDFFFTDVLTGRWIRNHFNDWQIHVAPDMVVALRDHVAITGDTGLLHDGGAELTFEIARFLASRVLRDEDGRDHVVRVLGPDEFHENVDDNAFTNHQVEAALRYALEVHARLSVTEPEVLQELTDTLGLQASEIVRWQDVADRLVLPQPDTGGVIEAFDGFHALEDVRPDDLLGRLQDPAEYWGWPNGVAVHTQVSKQADVVQLFVAQPARFTDEVMAANVAHYLPRTSHKSSLSRSAYAMVLARLGQADAAREQFVASAAVDLLAEGDHAPGGTFIGGLRTAAAGVSWSVAVLGFGGVGVVDGQVHVDPHLPEAWSVLSFTLDLHGALCRIHVDADAVLVTLDEDATGERHLVVAGTSLSVPPGGTRTVERV